MFCGKTTLWLSTFMAFAVREARAEEDSLLRALLAEAAESSPAIASAERALETLRALPAQAEALPDPWISISYQNEGLSPTLGSEIMSLLRIGWSQDLPYAGKRSLRSAVLLRDVEIAEQRVERVRLDVLASVRIAYYQILAARDLLELLREEEEIWRQIEAVARARYGVGEGVQQDVIRVQVELTRLEERRAELVADSYVNLAELNGLLGRSSGQPLESEEALRLRPLGWNLEQVIEEARERSPELRAARIGIERGQQGVSLAETERKPDFRLMGAYMNRGGLPGMWEAGVDMRLPLSHARWDAVLEEARASLSESESRLEALELTLRARTEQRYGQMEARERIASLYEEGIIPQDRLSVAAAIASYRAGSVPFVTVLEAQSRLYVDRATMVRNLVEHEAIRARLEAAGISDDGGFFRGSQDSSRGGTGGMGGMR